MTAASELQAARDRGYSEGYLEGERTMKRRVKKVLDAHVDGRTSEQELARQLRAALQ